MQLTPLIVFFLYYLEKKLGVCPHASSPIHPLNSITHGFYSLKYFLNLSTYFHSYNLCHLSPWLLFGLYKRSKFFSMKVLTKYKEIGTEEDSCIQYQNQMWRNLFLYYWELGPKLCYAIQISWAHGIWICFHAGERYLKLLYRKTISRLFTGHDKIHNINNLRQIK